MSKITLLRSDERGAAAIEMALAVPVMTLFLYGIFQIGVAFQANAGMQHALGQGARFATLCIDPDTENGCSSPSNDDIEEVMEESTFGTGIGEFTVNDVVDNAADGSKELSVTFTMTPNFIFFNGPEIDITREKKVYVAT